LLTILLEYVSDVSERSPSPWPTDVWHLVVPEIEGHVNTSAVNYSNVAEGVSRYTFHRDCAKSAGSVCARI
jgi:hypothetical protein